MIQVETTNGAASAGTAEDRCPKCGAVRMGWRPWCMRCGYDYEASSPAPPRSGDRGSAKWWSWTPPRIGLVPTAILAGAIVACLVIAGVVLLLRDPDPSEAVPRGELRVVTDPALPIQLTLGGMRLGNAPFAGDVSADTAWLCFGEAPNFIQPPCQLITVIPERLTTITGKYAPVDQTASRSHSAATGILAVVSRPAGVLTAVCINGRPAGIPVVSPGNGARQAIIVPLSAGEYQVGFGSVPGFSDPAPRRVEVSAGRPVGVVAEFRPEAPQPGSSEQREGGVCSEPVTG